MIETQVCVVGGGPAGMMLGLLLARQGIRVHVLEKHADFLRDFRGDTVHPSTLDVLDEIGLGEQVHALPGRQVRRLSVSFADGVRPVADFGRLRGAHPYLLFVPQWDLLEMLAREAVSYPTFTLLRLHEATDLLWSDGPAAPALTPAAGGAGDRSRRHHTHRHGHGVRVRGVIAHSPEGPVEIRADLTVGADGRDSTVRRLLDLPMRRFGAPMDVLWFRLSRWQSDGAGLAGHVGAGRMLVRIDRGEYWQNAFLIPKGGYAQVRREGIERLREAVAALVPELTDRVREIRDWDDVRLLSVQIDRARRWHAPGALVIGDAAHAMSPIGGVGINLAVQDAVAAARMLAEPLIRGTPSRAALAAVQRRRAFPAAVVQLAQRGVQRALLRPVLASDRPVPAPRPLRLLARTPALQGALAYAIGVGVRPEHL